MKHSFNHTGRRIALLSALTFCAIHSMAAFADAPAMDAETEAISEAISENESDAFAPAFCFSTTDFTGEDVDEQIYKDASLVMVNFWEPWCGPCVGEMPELASLYEEYKDQGFLILGVYTTPDMEEDIAALLDELGTTYPVLYGTEEFYPYMTQYVPTTVFFDGDGNLLSEEPTVGAMDRDAWEEIILSYLPAED